MSRRILVIVDNLPRAQFFARFRQAFGDAGHQYSFLCHKRSSYQHLKQLDAPVHLLTLSAGRSDASIDDQVGAKSLDVMRGDLSLKAAMRSVRAMVPSMRKVIEQTDPDMAFIWNGCQLVDRVLGQILPPHVERRYFEIANIPGKMFVDPQGVNAESSLYKTPQTLSATESPSEDEYYEWRESYLASKKSAGVPQVKEAQAIPWERLLDVLSSLRGQGFYRLQLNRMYSRVRGKLKTRQRMQELRGAYPHVSDSPYLFLPFQVSEDTQLLLNSDVDNLGALEFCVNHAVKQRLSLVAKLHPAENSVAAVDQLAKAFHTASKSVPFSLSTESTTELIVNAAEVCTINSTVGLETLIVGKPLSVLGRALFTHFINRPEWLRTYLLRYLIPVDYFHSDPISPRALDAILERQVGAPCTIY